MFATGTANPNLAAVAANGTPLQSIATDDTVAHSVAVDAASGALAVTVKGMGIKVYNLDASREGG
jgi:hypothetical protein